MLVNDRGMSANGWKQLLEQLFDAAKLVNVKPFDGMPPRHILTYGDVRNIADNELTMTVIRIDLRRPQELSADSRLVTSAMDRNNRANVTITVNGKIFIKLNSASREFIKQRIARLGKQVRNTRKDRRSNNNNNSSVRFDDDELMIWSSTNNGTKGTWRSVSKVLEHNAQLKNLSGRVAEVVARNDAEMNLDGTNIVRLPDYNRGGSAARSSKSVAWSWQHQQGTPEFVEECDHFLRKAIRDTSKRMHCGNPSSGLKTNLHQKTVAALHHPDHAVKRLLVVAETGAGKTLTIIKVLDNYIDQGANYCKVIFFPNRKSLDNFYFELFKFESKHRAWLASKLGRLPTKLDLEECKRLLHAGDDRVSPLRAHHYTQHKTMIADVRKFDNFMFVMDEIHNLVSPDDVYQQHAEKVLEVRQWIYNNPNARMLALTATPLPKSPAHFRKLMEVVRGRDHVHRQNYGYISWFMAFHSRIFARTTSLDPVVIRVPVRAEQMISAKEHEISQIDKYLHVTFNNPWSNPAHRQRILEDPERYAPKLARMASDIVQYLAELKRRNGRGGKAVVLMDPRHGMRHLDYMLRKLGLKTLEFTANDSNGSEFDLARGPSEKQDAFNARSNAYGEQYQVAILDHHVYSVSVSFFDVRLLVLASVPETYASLMQRRGRALRACGHVHLPPRDRHVSLVMYALVPPSSERDRQVLAEYAARAGGKRLTLSQTPDERRFAAVNEQRATYNRDMCAIKKFAVDARYLHAHGVRNFCTQ